jgi:hypothetical protein
VVRRRWGWEATIGKARRFGRASLIALTWDAVRCSKARCEAWRCSAERCCALRSSYRVVRGPCQGSLRHRCPDHRHDASFQGVGQRRPRIHNRPQIGIGNDRRPNCW